jgi:hypothetical protein
MSMNFKVRRFIRRHVAPRLKGAYSLATRSAGSEPSSPTRSKKGERSSWDFIGAGLAGHAPFQQSWQIRLSDASGQQALELRFSFLVSGNGFRRVAEVCAISFRKQAGRETSKIALKQGFDLSSFALLPKDGFRIGTCGFSPHFTKGSIQAKGQTIQWDLRLTPREEIRFELIPPALRKAAISKSSLSSLEADGLFDGNSSINGQETVWQGAPGVVGHQAGPLTAHSWIWAHCNHFLNEQGVPVPFVFEGITLRGQLLGVLPSPRFSSFHFLFKGKRYSFNSLRDMVHVKSRYSHNEWHFQAERGELVFRGHARVAHKDFAGLTLEDTRGALLYCATSNLSDLDIHVYRRGKLESALRAENSASIEIASRKKDPYVPLLV